MSQFISFNKQIISDIFKTKKVLLVMFGILFGISLSLSIINPESNIATIGGAVFLLILMLLFYGVGIIKKSKTINKIYIYSKEHNNISNNDIEKINLLNYATNGFWNLFAISFLIYCVNAYVPSIVLYNLKDFMCIIAILYAIQAELYMTDYIEYCQNNFLKQFGGKE